MHIHIYTYTHTHTHIHTFTYTLIYIHTLTYAYTHIYTYTSHIHIYTQITHTCIHTFTYHTHIYTDTHIHLHMHIHIYTHTHHIYIHIYTHTHISHIHIYIHSHIIHIHIYTDTHIHLHMHIHIYAQTYIRTRTHLGLLSKFLSFKASSSLSSRFDQRSLWASVLGLAATTLTLCGEPKPHVIRISWLGDWMSGSLGKGQGRGQAGVGVFSGLQTTECSQVSGPSLSHKERVAPIPLLPKVVTHRIGGNTTWCCVEPLSSVGDGGTAPVPSLRAEPILSCITYVCTLFSLFWVPRIPPPPQAPGLPFLQCPLGH